MSSSTRLAVRFSAGKLLELEAIHDSLCRSYNVGYAGLYDCGTYGTVYIQTATKKARMAPGKVLKICSEHGEVLGKPATFKRRDGNLVSEVGDFRKSGTHKCSSLATNDHATVINNVTTINNNRVTNNDNRVINNTNIYISINPVGGEDLSHITLERFKSILCDSKEELHEYVRKQHASEDEYETVIERAWQAVRNVLYQKHCEQNHGPPLAENAEPEIADDAGESSDDEDDDGADYPINTPEILAEMLVDGEAMRYDTPEDSQYNQQARERVGAVTMLDLAAVDKSYKLPYEMAELIFENPHNVNVVHAKKAGFFEYFDGENNSWTSEDLAKLRYITDNWKKRCRDFYGLLKAKYGTEWVDSFHGIYAMKAIKMFNFVHPDCVGMIRSMEAKGKKDALRVIEKANTRIKDIRRRTGKRLRRVLSDNDFQVRGKKVLRNTTWNDLEAMDV